jgi:hypothetical protein
MTTRPLIKKSLWRHQRLLNECAVIDVGEPKVSAA